jgi:hypothetical protein
MAGSAAGERVWADRAAIGGEEDFSGGHTQQFAHNISDHSGPAEGRRPESTIPVFHTNSARDIDSGQPLRGFRMTKQDFPAA